MPPFLTFSPGPSKISDETKKDIELAVEQDILSMSHRSSQFSDISEKAIEGLRNLLNIPKDYHVFYLDSASSAWHSIIANTVEKESFHFNNGAFSSKAESASQALYKKTFSQTVDWGSSNTLDISISKTVELITICHNETSTGVMVPLEDLKKLRQSHPSPLLAIDITSSAGAIDFEISEADIWYFSVQKCFGLPAGLGIQIVSPRAFARSQLLQKKQCNLAGMWRWESLQNMQNKKPYQTLHTPNVLNIYLLAQQCQRWLKCGGIHKIMQEVRAKKQRIEYFIDHHPELDFFIQNTHFRSDTVLTISTDPDIVQNMHQRAEMAQVQLGKGYGKLSASTFRIANFPVITDADLDRLFEVLKS